MLKRRRRIQKYISALKLKRRGGAAREIQKLKLQDPEPQQPQPKREEINRNAGVSIPRLHFGTQEADQQETDDKPLWEDSDDELPLPAQNKFKKLQLDQQATEKQYEERLRRFYNSKYSLQNWAVQGEGEYEKDLNDLLNHEQVYGHNTHKKEGVTVQFIARTSEHHNSIVSGLDWKGQVVASCGYDQKLKLWSLRADQSNPELRLKLEKDVYCEGYALSNCYFRDSEIILGSMRKNYLAIDCEKWSINRVTSSFLNDHRTFQNIRLSNDKNTTLLFSDNKISLLNRHNSFEGGIVAGQPLEDVQMPSQHKILAISKDFAYEWDLRTWRLVNSHKFYNGFTKLWAQDDVAAIGNRLGVINLFNSNEQLQHYAEVPALVTHVTELKGNKKGDLLVECSKWKQNAVRIIDVHKGRVVAGWPAVNTKLRLPTVAGFSERDQLCVANTHGFLTFFNVAGK